MQPLDVACFGPLSRAYRTALQDWIYEGNRNLGKQEFWELLSTARKASLTPENICSGFAATGIYPLCPEVVLDRRSTSNPHSEVLGDLPQTPHKASKLRKDVDHLALTPCTRATVEEWGTYLESKLTYYRVVQPNAPSLKVLRNGKTIAPRSQKHLRGPRVLDRAYIACEKARIAAKESEKVAKVAAQEDKKILKQQQLVEQATARGRGRGGQGGRGSREGRVGRVGRARGGAQATIPQAGRGDSNDLEQIEGAIAYLAVCGKLPSPGNCISYL